MEKEKLSVDGDMDLKSALAKFGWVSDGDALKQLVEFSKFEEHSGESVDKVSIYHGFGP